MATFANHFNPSQVSVTSSATLILTHIGNGARKGCIVVNTGGATVFLGRNSSVTAATGFPLLAGAALNLDAGIAYQGDIYGITSSATVTVGVAEFT